MIRYGISYGVWCLENDIHMYYIKSWVIVSLFLSEVAFLKSLLIFRSKFAGGWDKFIVESDD